MRFAIAVLLVMAGLPAAEAQTAQKRCQTACDAQYKFCLKAATTKQIRKGCKTKHKTCKKGCVATPVTG